MGCFSSSPESTITPTPSTARDQDNTLEELWKRLHNSIINGNSQECQSILDNYKIDLNEIHKTIKTQSEEEDSTLVIAPIHLACILRRTTMTDILCRHGADISLKDKFGRSPINICVQYWPRVSVYDLNIGDSWIALQSMKIIEDLNENSARCLYILLHNGADPSEIIDTEGDTLLHFCAKKGLYDALNILIVAGANIESINTIGLTPLLYSAKHGSIQMVKMLSSFAVESAKDSYGNGLLHILCQNERFSAEVLKQFIDKSTINICNKLGQTPLMISSQLGNCKKIDILLQNGAEPSMADKSGKTSLFYLLEHNDPVFCLLGFYNLLLFTYQICIYDKERQIPSTLKENNLRYLRIILEKESSTPTSLYRISFYKVSKMITKSAQTDRASTMTWLRSCPHAISTDLLTFRETMSKYWHHKLAGPYIQNDHIDTIKNDII